MPVTCWKLLRHFPSLPSLSRRLSGLFAASTALLLTLLAGSTYGLLDREFRVGETRMLDDTVALLQTLLKQNDDFVQMLRSDLPAELEAFHFNRYQLRVDDSNGQTLYETRRFPELTPDFVDHLPEVRGSSSERGTPWTEGTSSYLVVQARAQRQRGSQQEVRLLVALDTSVKTRTLSIYSRALVVLVLLGVGIAALLAGWITRQGLAPLRLMTRLVMGLKMDQLGQRFSRYPWPRELRPLASEFDRLLAEIELGVERLSHFSLDLAHELRTPLTTMMLQAEVTLSQPRSVEEYQEVLGSATEELERLTKIVQRLLLLARTEASRAHLQVEPVALKDLSERLVDFYLEDAGEVRIPAQRRVHWDRQLLELALGNLVSNAAKYGEPPIVISWSENEEGGTLMVDDQGPGIAEEHHPYLFDRFYRIDPARRRDGDSHGLGLALVRSAMESGGGSVRVRSAGTGTRFELWFPATALLP